VADALSLISAKPACVIDQQDIEQVQAGVFQELLKLGPVPRMSARYKLGVPPAPQYNAVALGESFDVVVLNLRSESVFLVQCRISDISLSPEPPEIFECPLALRSSGRPSHSHPRFPGVAAELFRLVTDSV
jgi:hypothetical protein